MTDPQAPPPDVADLVRRLRKWIDEDLDGTMDLDRCPGFVEDAEDDFYCTHCGAMRIYHLAKEAADALAPQLEKFEKENARPNGALQTVSGGRSLPLPPTKEDQ